MKNMWIFIMLLALFTQNTELHQLGKLPVLFEHFAEHQQRDAKVNFVQFLAMHYWGQDLNDDDDSRDMQLPFKSFDAHPVHLHFLPAMAGWKVATAVFHIALNYPGYLPSYTPNPALSAPFRPPRA